MACCARFIYWFCTWCTWYKMLFWLTLVSMTAAGCSAVYAIPFNSEFAKEITYWSLIPFGVFGAPFVVVFVCRKIYRASVPQRQGHCAPDPAVRHESAGGYWRYQRTTTVLQWAPNSDAALPSYEACCVVDLERTPPPAYRSVCPAPDTVHTSATDPTAAGVPQDDGSRL